MGKGHRRGAAVCIFLLALLAPSVASAQSCSFSISNVAFSAVDNLSGRSSDTTATLSVSCTGAPLSQVLVCPNLGEGSGGATAAQRRLVSGDKELGYQLYQDPARSIVWGSFLWPFPARPPELVVGIGPGGTGSLTRAIYARIFGRQGGAPAGQYLSAFSGAFTDFRYGPLRMLSCAAMPSMMARPSFAVTAPVMANCMVTTRDVDFGTQGVLSSNIDATGQLEVTCTAGTTWTVGLNGGMSGGPPTARQMRNGSDAVTYGLYRDAARTQPWGDLSLPGSVATGTGTGQPQGLSVYGRVPPQRTPPAGTYTDTVAVTVTY